MTNEQSVTVSLKSPVEHGGVTYSTLTFREITTGDLALSDKVQGEFSRVIAMMASMSETPLPAMMKIKLSDFNKIVAEVAPLMGEYASAGGSTSSL